MPADQQARLQVEVQTLQIPFRRPALDNYRLTFANHLAFFHFQILVARLDIAGLVEVRLEQDLVAFRVGVLYGYGGLTVVLAAAPAFAPVEAAVEGHARPFR